MKNISDKNIHLFYPDLIRTVAIYLVLLIHVSAMLFYSFSNKWASVNFFDSASRVAVPLFFMLSGALLINKQEPIGLFFRKRFIKVIIPLFIWSCIYLSWLTYRHGAAGQNWLLQIMKGPVYYHLGFIYSIIGVYVAVPIIRAFYATKSAYLKIYFLTFCMISASIFPLYTLLTEQPKPIGIDLSFFSAWIGYFVLGGFLTEYKVEKNRNWFLLLFLAASLSTGLLTYWWSLKLGAPNESFYIYEMPNVVLGAIGLFCYLKSCEPILSLANKTIKTCLSSIGKTSYGIYLVHPIILELLASGILFQPLNAEVGNPYLSIPLIALLCLAISHAIILILKKIPILKHSVP